MAERVIDLAEGTWGTDYTSRDGTAAWTACTSPDNDGNEPFPISAFMLAVYTCL